MSKVEIYNMDCMEAMAKMKDNFIDAIVTDPPYGLSFMGKKWDYDVPSVEIWKECLRVLKPGGHLLSFGGSRTYHRMAVNIEDAGFEIRDMIAWVYGSGFPKSLNIGKAVDKLRKVSDKLAEFSSYIKNRREELKISQSEADKFICNGTTMYSFFEGRKDKPLYFPNNEHYKKMKELLKLDNSWDDIVLETNENIVGYEEGDFGFQKHGERWGGKKKIVELSMRASEWEGWGTALKPAHEPIVLARKPISEKSIAENCLKWGVGGINIDGCRIPLSGDKPRIGNTDESKTNTYGWERGGIYKSGTMPESGRFPSNFIHDGSQEVLDLFPQSAGQMGDLRAGIKKNKYNCYGDFGQTTEMLKRNDSGSAARFFYCAKASKSERNRGCEGLEAIRHADRIIDDGVGGNNPRNRTNTPKQNFHPTVKPIALMEYLVKLVTREGQIVLDPFAGSGTTGIACKNLNREAILIEREAEYVEIAECRNS
jgi:DNA modification methylase